MKLTITEVRIYDLSEFYLWVKAAGKGAIHSPAEDLCNAGRDWEKDAGISG